MIAVLLHHRTSSFAPVQFHGHPAGEEVALIHVGTAALGQPQRQLGRLRLCLAQWARSFGKTDIYLAAVLSYETMQDIVGYCFFMTIAAALWVAAIVNMRLTRPDDVLTPWISARVEVRNMSGTVHLF